MNKLLINHLFFFLNLGLLHVLLQREENLYKDIANESSSKPIFLRFIYMYILLQRERKKKHDTENESF